MSDEKQARYLLTNHQSQPLELHLPGGVLVIGPRGESEVPEAVLSVPQVRALARSRIVSAREVTPSATAPDAPEAPDAPDSSSSPSPRPSSPNSRSKTKTPAKEA